MATTQIIECTHCQRLLMSPKNQKTKTCPYCGTKIDLAKAKKIASAPTAFAASEILKTLKNRKSFKT